MANVLLTPSGWSYWTGMASDLKPDTQFLTKTLIGSVGLGSPKVKASPIEQIKYDFYIKPQPLAPMRGFHDENVNVATDNVRESRVALIPSMPLESDVDIREVFDSVPPPMEDIRASAERLNSVVKSKVREQQIDLRNMQMRRVEEMLAQAIATFAYTYNDGKFTYSHDYQLYSGFKFQSSVLWSNSETTPMEDLRTWRNTFAKMNGKRPAVILCGENVADLISYNSTIMTKLTDFKDEFGTFVPELDSNTLVERLIRIRGIGDIYSYFGQYDASGTRTNYLDKDRIYFINPDAFKLYYGSIYSTMFGSNPVQQRDVFSYVEEKPNHKGYKVLVESKPFPIIEHPYGVMSIKVL